ncbi:helix-turn-helix domain-containing protein [Streptomyces sp. SID13031]|uniref:winged helix-turn-helix transcriptional regulator n=1 Tax=Streptomyces sp. SID13031 TaxID=2706046 RepID=UPI0013C7F286|nr:helix-turn-helix domain-containing protein [Streptomyces sp. SID13031]NEA36948.1 helix-turn-helix transcriptional regulator [Streptomyces sp. SID13031]
MSQQKLYTPPEGRNWNVLSSQCPSRTSLARIANKWTAMTVVVLENGPLRFGDRTALDGISGKVLTDTLRDLERDGMVSRRSYAEVPPRVEYELTPLGRTLQGPLTTLCRWAEEHIPDVLAARDAYDER